MSPAKALQLPETADLSRIHNNLASLVSDKHKPLGRVQTLSVMAKEISSQVDIEAPAERVWELLTNFASFPEWNPFIHEIDGTLDAGNRLRVRLQPSGGRSMTFNPKVLKVEPNRELRWRGRVLMPGLFDGEHSFTIEPLGERRVRFTQSERFSGLFVPFFSTESAKRGFEEMNKALKARAEQL